MIQNNQVDIQILIRMKRKIRRVKINLINKRIKKMKIKEKIHLIIETKKI
jgi:hypothetical protein